LNPGMFVDKADRSGGFRPDEFRTQAVIDRTTVRWLGVPFRCVVECVISGLGERGFFVAHDVRHRDADAFLFVVEHQGGTTIGTGAKLKWAVLVFLVERLAVNFFGVVDRKVVVFEENHMRGLLASHALTDIAMTNVVVDRLCRGFDVNVVTTTRIGTGHSLFSVCAYPLDRSFIEYQ